MSMKIERMEGGEAGADETWIAHDGGGACGRVGLWWRDVPAMADARIGCIGDFDARDETAARAVLEAGCARLAELGCGLAVGPMDGNTWRRHRFVTDAGMRPPFFLEPWNPAPWPAWWERAGFAALSRYSSSRLDLTDDSPPMDRLERRLAERGVVLRELDAARYEEELRSIHRLSLAAFANNFLYTPLGADEFVAMYGKVRELVRPGFVWLADCGGELAGFVFGVPDVLAMQRGEAADFIVKTLAVDPRSRAAGLGSLLVDRVQRSAREAGFGHAIHALQHESNTSLRITGRFGGEVIRRYALYAKRL